MILTTRNTAGKKVEIYDINGTLISPVYYFNTKTGLLKMYLTGENKHLKKPKKILMSDIPTKKGGFRRKLTKISVKLAGAYAVVNGKIVK